MTTYAGYLRNLPTIGANILTYLKEKNDYKKSKTCWNN